MAIALTLYVDLSAEAENGPGWYAYAANSDGTSVPKVLVPDDLVRALGQAFIHALEQAGTGQCTHVINHLIDDGDVAIKVELQNQLRTAEEYATRIGMLRRRLADTTPATLETHAQGPQDQ